MHDLPHLAARLFVEWKAHNESRPAAEAQINDFAWMCAVKLKQEYERALYDALSDFGFLEMSEEVFEEALDQALMAVDEEYFIGFKDDTSANISSTFNSYFPFAEAV